MYIVVVKNVSVRLIPDCHFQGTILDVPELLEFAKLGCYIEYDLFGIETSNYQLKPEIDMPSDAQRVDRIKALVEAGHEDKITVAQDIHTKHRLVGWDNNIIFLSFSVIQSLYNRPPH